MLVFRGFEAFIVFFVVFSFYLWFPEEHKIYNIMRLSFSGLLDAFI
jgi:hypothetical protein